MPDRPWSRLLLHTPQISWSCLLCLAGSAGCSNANNHHLDKSIHVKKNKIEEEIKFLWKGSMVGRYEGSLRKYNYTENIISCGRAALLEGMRGLSENTITQKI